MFEYNKYGRIYDYSEGKMYDEKKLTQLIIARITFYQAKGLKRFDKIILAHGNNHLFFVDLLSLWNLGVCVIPVDEGISNNELNNLAKHSGAKYVVFRRSSTIVENISDHKEFQALITDDISTEINFNHVSIQSRCSLDDDALMLYTSGSTGSPKGVVHTHRSLSAKIATLQGILGSSDIRVTLNLLPTHFGHGLICNCLFPFLTGNTLVLLPSFSLDILTNLGKIIDDFGVTFMSSVPAVWKIAVAHATKPKNSNLRRIHCGSAPLSTDLINQVKDWSSGADVINVYGITEVGSWIGGIASTEESAELEDGFIGKPWGAEFQVTREDNIQIIYEGVPASQTDPDEIGYIWIRTPTLMKYYYQNPDVTKEFVFGSWFFTGDKGKVDKNGNLTLKGRVRNEINKGGIKIMPEDIDLQLEKHPDITEACTFAVPDVISGQDVNVAVVISDESKLNEVKTWLKKNISAYKVPSKWFVVESIPKTDRGKVNRSNVSDYCLSELSKK